jgi:hypothetical protein
LCYDSSTVTAPQGLTVLGGAFYLPQEQTAVLSKPLDFSVNEKTATGRGGAQFHLPGFLFQRSMV